MQALGSGLGVDSPGCRVVRVLEPMIAGAVVEDAMSGDKVVAQIRNHSYR